MKRQCCVYDIMNNIHLERFVLNKVTHARVCLCVCMQQHRAMPAQRITPCPEQIRITNFYYHHLCLLHDSRTNINLFLSFFLICASERGHLKPGQRSTAKIIARIALLAWN